MRIRGTSLIEMLVALAILSCGFLPLFNLLRGTRTALAQTRETLLLERRAHEALAHAAGLAAEGRLRDLAPREERTFDLTDAEVRMSVSVTRVSARLLRLTAITESRARRVTLSRELFDPQAAFENPLTEPDGR